MLSTQTALDAYFLPDDAEEALAVLVAHLRAVRQSYRGFMYGFTHAKLADEIARLPQRGVDVRLILDHSQSCGPTEAALVHSMILNGFPADRLCICTSSLHQLMHLKMGVCDGEAPLPDAQYETVAGAAAQGYPRIFEGSLNWSASGFKQMNSLLIIPSKPLALASLQMFEQQWDWAYAHEPHYQMAA